MKLSFSTLGCPEWDLETIAARAAEYGYDGVELRCWERTHISPEFTKAEREDAVDLFKRHGVEIACLSAYSRFTMQDEAEARQNVDMGKAAVDLAVDVGAPIVRVFGGAIPENMDRADCVAMAAPRIQELGEHAEGTGVSVCVETHDSFCKGAELAELLRTVTSPAIGITWDLHHPFRFGETLEETAGLIFDRTRHTHIKDGTADGALVLVGEGRVPIREFVQLMTARGYDGYFSLEWEKMWHPEIEEPEAAFPHYVDYMRV